MATRTKLKRAEIEEVFARFANASPEPLGELDFTTTFTLLVAVVLSAQTTDKAVNLATKQLLPWPIRPRRWWRWARTGSWSTPSRWASSGPRRATCSLCRRR
jgi:hypothetical protein